MRVERRDRRRRGDERRREREGQHRPCRVGPSVVSHRCSELCRVGDDLLYARLLLKEGFCGHEHVDLARERADHLDGLCDGRLRRDGDLLDGYLCVDGLGGDARRGHYRSRGAIGSDLPRGLENPLLCCRGKNI